jgi:hypothetical protein
LVIDQTIGSLRPPEVGELPPALEDQRVIEPAVLDAALEADGVLDVERQPVAARLGEQQVIEPRGLDEDERAFQPRSWSPSAIWSAPMTVDPFS